MTGSILDNSERPSGAAPDVTLLLPAFDEVEPEFSIVIPAMNEEITIERFVKWCKEGIEAAGIKAEILIIDSSSDRTAEIAVANGARVLKSPKRGLGRAYIDALPFIRGRYIIMGDADCTYDFREIGGFVQKCRDGYEFIMGSRFAGTIEEGAMPPLHQYFGSPLTTFLLNIVYSTHYSDINCGMRAMTRDGFERIALTSQGWEYASEMIVKAEKIGLRTTEVPIHFYKDQKGRLSHIKRSGWTQPWSNGWHTLKIILTYGSSRVIRPISLALSSLAIVVLCALSLGPVTVLGIELSLHTLLLASTVLILGISLWGISILSICINDRIGEDIRYWSSTFQFTRSMIIGSAGFLVGLLLCFVFLIQYISSGYLITGANAGISHLSVIGLTLMSLSVLFASFAILLQALADRIQVSETIISGR